jgi:hypothetical protein
MEHLPPPTAKLPGLLRKIAALIATTALVALVLMFSAVLFAIILISGIAAFTFLWWKTRHIRKLMRNFPLHGEMRDSEMMGDVMWKEDVIKGEVIEGEAIRVVDPRDDKHD